MEPPDNGERRPKVLRFPHASDDLEEYIPPDPTLWPVRDRPARLANPDWMRGLLAALLIGTLCVIAVMSLVFIATAKDPDKVSKGAALVFSALSGITGAISGFYFSSRGGRT
jgi:hypothetical protein